MVIDVTLVSLRVSSSMLSRALALLDDTERASASTRVGDARRRFLVAHAAARVVIAERLRVDPAGLRIASEDRGRPVVEGVAFSLSHSAERAAVAVAAPTACIGVDIERVRNRPHLDRLAQRVFRPDEYERGGRWRSRRAHAFAQRWTEVEAMLKARGTGIAGGLATAMKCRRDGRAPTSTPAPVTSARSRPTPRRSRCARTPSGSATCSHVVAELHAEPRPGAAVFGTLCSHVRWLVPPITSRSPPCSTNGCEAPPPFGRMRSTRRSPSETIANDGIDDLVRDAVAVPGDAVATVAVERGAEVRELAVVALRSGHRRWRRRRGTTDASCGSVPNHAWSRGSATSRPCIVTTRWLPRGAREHVGQEIVGAADPRGGGGRPTRRAPSSCAARQRSADRSTVARAKP